MAEASAQPNDEAVQAFEAAAQLEHGSGVRDADVLLGPEGLAGNYGNEVFRQQALGKLQGVLDALLAESGADVGVGVEGTVGLGALDARDFIQAPDDEIAALAVFGEHDL